MPAMTEAESRYMHELMELVQKAGARHEREQIVAWLRTEAERTPAQPALRWAADVIEGGIHK